jgi:hypothetical protein
VVRSAGQDNCPQDCTRALPPNAVAGSCGALLKHAQGCNLDCETGRSLVGSQVRPSVRPPAPARAPARPLRRRCPQCAAPGRSRRPRPQPVCNNGAYVTTVVCTLPDHTLVSASADMSGAVSPAEFAAGVQALTAAEGVSVRCGGASGRQCVCSLRPSPPAVTLLLSWHWADMPLRAGR